MLRIQSKGNIEDKLTTVKRNSIVYQWINL